MKNAQNRQSPKAPRLAGILMLALFALPMIGAALIPFTGQRDASVAENRALQRLPAFSPEGALSGTFQDELEQGLIDQLPLGEEIKSWALDRDHDLLNVQQALLYAAAPDLKTAYSPIAAGYYHYAGDERRIVEKPRDYSENQAHLDALAENFRNLDGVRLCLYFIENSRTVDFDHPDTEHTIYRQVRDALQPDAADFFPVPDYAAYQANFYQTDHHWNDRGAYAGYQAVYRLLHGTEEGMIPAGDVVETDAVFQGSYARQTHVLCADECFAFRQYDLPAFTTVINGRRRTYGNQSAYAKGKYASGAMANHYATCFGGDFAQIEYDFGAQGKGKLLVVASSYSNPINALIAAGYDTTYVIDLRYYEAWAGQPFDAAAFCRDNGIDTVLLLGDVNLFYVDGPEEGAE